MKTIIDELVYYKTEGRDFPAASPTGGFPSQGCIQRFHDVGKVAVHCCYAITVNRLGKILRSTTFVTRP